MRYDAERVRKIERIARIAGGTSAVTFGNRSEDVGLVAVHGASSNAARADSAPALSEAIVPTWTGVHTHSERPVFDAGIDLSTDGSALSSVASGAGAYAFDLVDEVARSAGGTMRVRNSNATKEQMIVTYDGRFSFGNNTTLSAQDGHVLGFLAEDSHFDGTPTYATGVLGFMKHTNTGLSLTQPVTGLAGAGVAGSHTGLSDVVGIVGVGVGDVDGTGQSGQRLAGVLGRFAGHETLSTLERAIDALPASSQVLRGDWGFVAAIYGEYTAPSAAKGTPTNRPAIACSVYAPVQGWTATSGEQWGIYSDAPTTGSPSTPAIGGGIYVEFPARGTRKTHLHLVPTAAASGGPTGAIAGDVYFDDGTNNTVGLYYHNGSTWTLC